MSMPHGRLHATGPIAMSMLHVHVHASCPCPFCMCMSMLLYILKQIEANWGEYLIFQISFVFEANILNTVKANWSEYFIF
jgi:hypothetical protein